MPPLSSQRRRQRKPRDESIDILRGLTSLAMILVNTANSPPRFLTHASNITDSITFADTIFPCFLFTAGLAEGASGPPTLKMSLKRAVYLSTLGVAFNNLPRVLGQRQRGGLWKWQTYRLPSVLGRLGIATVIGASGLHPALLTTLWHLLISPRPLDPPGESTQAVLDRAVFGRGHLYDPVMGFDPEGLLGSFLTAPVSLLLGRQAYAIANGFRPRLSLSVIPEAALLALLSGLVPALRVPPSKAHWTPTFVGVTTVTSLLYWAVARLLSRLQVGKVLATLGCCTLEVYLFSSFLHGVLRETGLWASGGHLLMSSLGLSNQVVSTLTSSALALGMVPISRLLLKRGWLIRL